MPDNINDDSAIDDTNELIHCSKASSSNKDFYVIETIVGTWSKQHQSEINLREKYAIYLVELLVGETVLVLGILVFIGLGWLCFSESILRLFLELTICAVSRSLFYYRKVYIFKG